MNNGYTFNSFLRLKNKKDFQFVYNKGKSFVDYAGIFYVVKTDSLEHTKIAVVAGKKLGNAVIRNKTKRLMREIYRHFQHKICVGFKVIWIARKPLVNADINFFEKNFLKLAKRSNILLNKSD